MTAADDDARPSKPSAALRDGGRAGAGVTPRLYERAFDILAAEIQEGTLPVGARLSETGVAERFEVSRAPARRALWALVDRGLVVKAPGRGFTVAAGNAQVTTPLPVPETRVQRTALAAAPTWHRIYGEVERELAARIAFAGWRVGETALAAHYRVSRTIARDVLSRLQQRGIVAQDERGRWHAPALSPARIAELYELRWTLEPLALVKAAPQLKPARLDAMAQQLDQLIDRPDRITGPVLDQLEDDMHVQLLRRCGNATLMQAITLPQSLLIAHSVLYAWAPRLYATEPFLAEHLEIVACLRAGAADAAAAALRSHLQVSSDRATRRVETLTGRFEPDNLAYLERIDDG